MIKWMITGIFFIHLFITISLADNLKTGVVIGIFPCTDMVNSFEKFHPLVTYLNEQTRLNPRLITSQTFEEYERAIKKGELDFALEDPYIFYMKLPPRGHPGRVSNFVVAGIHIPLRPCRLYETCRPV